MTPWHVGRMAALDFESSDKDAETARIVTAALILLGGELPTDTRTWLISPGIPMHLEAIKVHGITDEYAAEHGMDPVQGVTEIVQALSEVIAAGVPIVGHNVGGYDLNLLDREGRRHLGAGLDEAIPDCSDRWAVIDTMVLDRRAAPYRRRVSEAQGPYQMKTTAQVYGLGWDDKAAHGAEYDALQSARAAYRMGAIAHTPPQERPEWVRGLVNWRGEPYERFNDLAGIDVRELHRRQIEWARQDAASYQAWLRNPKKAKDKHDPNAVIDGRWPLIPHQRGAE